MSWNALYRIIVVLFLFGTVGYGQEQTNFWKRSDSLHTSRLRTVVISETAATTGAFIGLYQLWYKAYPKSKFHFINDNKEWLQMDKAGHVYSAYHLSRVGADLLDWAGTNNEQQLIYGAGLGFLLMTSIEVFDGYSQEWGASSGDLIANALGSGLYIGQRLLWDELRIQPKFSFHTTSYAKQRPSILGSNIQEQILKDYNGQTYWLSFNLHSFIQKEGFPQWLNLAFGYGADGMITGNLNSDIPNYNISKERTRQFYLSLDLDLTKIKTKNYLLKTFFNNFNMLKIPAPTLEIRGNGRLIWHPLYF